MTGIHSPPAGDGFLCAPPSVPGLSIKASGSHPHAPTSPGAPPHASSGTALSSVNLPCLIQARGLSRHRLCAAPARHWRDVLRSCSPCLELPARKLAATLCAEASHSRPVGCRSSEHRRGARDSPQKGMSFAGEPSAPPGTHGAGSSQGHPGGPAGDPPSWSRTAGFRLMQGQLFLLPREMRDSLNKVFIGSQSSWDPTPFCNTFKCT